ncbi:hypothetical protein BT69DRAFT_551039 [Atractiella rhizophila]|nr:hypothetical protein BT69DRAFT_551039 [Atractiella rhizophila]
MYDCSGRTPTKMTLSIAPAPVSTPAPAEQDPERQAALQRIQSTLLSSKTSATGPTRRGTTRGRRGEKPAPSPDVPPLPLNPNGFASHLPPPVPENEVAANPFSSSPASIPDNLVNGHSQPATIVVKVQEEISVTSHNGVVGPATVSGTIVVSPSNSKKTESAPIPDVEFDVVPSANIETISVLNDLVSAHPSVLNRYIIDKRCFQNSGFIFGGLPLLHYTVKGDISIPLHARTAWKTEEHLTSLIVSYEPNSGYPLNLLSLDNLSISALIPNSVTSHQARPEGEMDTSTNRLVWNLEPHARTERSKILARFATVAKGDPFPITLNWITSGPSLLQVEALSSVMGERVTQVLANCTLL